MAQELSEVPPMESVQAAVVRAYGDVWESEVQDVRPDLETVSVAVTREGKAGSEVLLLLRTKELGGFWQLVTGRREASETSAQAAAREVAEETGQALSVRSLQYRHAFAFGEASPPTVAVEEAFAARWEGDAKVKLGPEHTDFAWVGVEEALQRLPFSGLRRAVERATSRPGTPAWR
jgi:lipoyl(octanoyl) transferase